MSSELQTTLGAMEIGTLVSSILFGINTMQVYLYFRGFPGDPRGLKALVASVFVLDIIHTVLLIQSSYHYGVFNFGDIMDYDDMTVPYYITVVLTGLITFVVQSFFSYRIYVVTRSAATATLCLSMAAIRLGFSLSASGQAISIHNLVVYGNVLHWDIIANASVGAISDVLIAAILCIALIRNRSGVERTSKIVDRVIAYTISNGLLTSMITISGLICYATMYRNFVWLAHVAVIAKLFSSSLFASLNARTSMRKDIDMYTFQSVFNAPPGDGFISSRTVAGVHVEMGTITSGQMTDDENIQK